jgi:hypothetical protein
LASDGDRDKRIRMRYDIQDRLVLHQDTAVFRLPGWRVLMRFSPIYSYGFAIIALIGCAGVAQADEPNYDESKVPKYILPDPLVGSGGHPVDTADGWRQDRRREILDLFAADVFGRSPEAIDIQARVVSVEESAANGKAIRREIDLTLHRNDQSLTLPMLVYTPREKTNVPTFLGLNFHGNHTVDPDPSIRMTESWVRQRDAGATDGNRATEEGRGSMADRWPIEMIIDRGYGVATIYYGDIDPDFDDGFQNGIHPLFRDWAQEIPEGERWGSISAWAYGLSRALDYLEQDPLVDGARVAVVGHSRLGKTALWAGAQDERFRLVISNNSGCGGAALSRRAFGETVARINRVFPHWFCLNHRKYNENESALPVDHHQLIALMAPRAVYVASATEDRWADPRGEFLACVHADPVYRLLGIPGLGGDVAPPSEMPPPDHPIHEGSIGYHLRTGKHSIAVQDWQNFLDFADKHL